MKQTIKVLLVTIITFGLFYILLKHYFSVINDFIDNFISVRIISYLFTYIFVGLPLFIGLIIIHKPNKILNSIGIDKGFIKGFLFAFLITLPMLIGYSMIYKFSHRVTFNSIVLGSIFAGFFEELYFRGFLFGQLFRFTKIGFIPSVLICALLFAIAHLWQSSDFSTLIGIFLTTFLGATWFAWLYIEWDNNLWIPIGLHLFMNLHWDLFSAGNNAFGNFYSNIFRIATITLSILITILYKRQKGKNLTINKNNLIINKNRL